MCEDPWLLKPIVQTPMRLFASGAAARDLFRAAMTVAAVAAKKDRSGKSHEWW